MTNPRVERARADAAARELAWDEVRERRVLARVKQARAGARERARQRWAWLTPPRLGLGVALAGAAAALALVFTLRDDLSEPATVTAARPASTAAPGSPAPTLAPTEPPLAGSRMGLPDGSLAVLGPGAQVELLDLAERADARVVVEQSAGEVRYEVSRDPGHEFVVRTKGVEIRVIGTVFTVVASDARVLVEVEHGRVEVLAGERRSQLGPGDSLGVQLDALGTTARPGEPAQPAPSKPRAPAAVGVDELLAAIDAARLAGDDARAAKLLRTVVREHPRDPRAATAAFTLGRVERGRGRDRAAAEAFADYLELAPAGVLAEDALAEQARAWAAAGEQVRARSAASRYLERWPTGTHATPMRELAEG